MATKLKSLELHGYKTFARQTLLQFPARITAIVGPNGSGKSNVADSIRWVLGEQSYSLLRAKKTEDMIYAGSENRARSGMAAVSITFSNEEGWLPIDFNEVVLTRRAYRDGQNEYLINNQRVRLKDFHELLGKTGLSDRTYTIIGQGLVDLALSIKPDERRLLFEEAAGIGLYRERKEEALKRLETTNRNLERALDILEEIKPRLKNLEKQAARVNEYKLVQEALRRNLREWYGHHWYSAREELNRQAEALESIQQRVEQARAQQAAAHQEGAQLNEQLREAREMLSNLHEHIRQVHNDLQNRNQTLTFLAERKASAVEALRQLESDFGSLQEELVFLSHQKEEALAEINQNQSNLSTLTEEHRVAESALNSARSEQQQLNRERSELQSRSLSTEKESISLKSRHRELNERASNLRASRAANEKNLTEMATKVAVARQKLEEASAHSRELENQLAALTEKRLAAETQVRELRAALEGHNQKVSRYVLEKNQYTSKLELLRQARESMAGFSEGAKAIVKRSAMGSLHGQVSDLATRLEVPEKFEKAIAAALGEAVDLLILRQNHLDNQLLSTLRQNLKDRAAILAEKDASPRLQPFDQKVDGVFGCAADLVNIEPGLEKIKDALLGHFVVVTDSAAALHVRAQLKEWDLVTLDGEVYFSSGVAILGQTGNTSKVAYRRQIQEVEKQVGEVNALLNEAQETARLTRSQLEALEAGLNAQISKEKDLSEKATLARKAESAAVLEADKLANQTQWLDEQNRQIDAQLARLDQELEALSEKEKQNEALTQELNNRMNAVRQKQQSFQVSELEQKFQFLETERKMMLQAQAHAQTSAAALEARLGAAQRRQQDLQARMAAAQAQLKEIDAKTNLEHEQIKAVEAEDIGKENATIEEKNALVAELEARLATQQQVEDERQKELDWLERQATHVQLELARQQEKQSALRSRIEDDFGLITLEVSTPDSSETPLPFPDLVIEKLIPSPTLPEGIDEEIRQQKAQMRRIGVVNFEAEAEFMVVRERHDSLAQQVEDLKAAITDIQRIIKELDEIMASEFLKTFKAVSTEFSHMFARLFNGGSARLTLSDEEFPIDGGIEIEARLPGRREQGLVLLSGGERSLTAVALVFALLKISPTPFCVLDEVDAMLDESNVGRFIELLRDLSKETQFLLITHNRNTVSAADVIYGVTMGKDSASQVISMKLDEVDDQYLK